RLEQARLARVFPIALGLRDVAAVIEEDVTDRAFVGELSARRLPERANEQRRPALPGDIDAGVVGRSQNAHEALAGGRVHRAEPRHTNAVAAVSDQPARADTLVIHRVENALVHGYDQPRALFGYERQWERHRVLHRSRTR